MTNYSDLGNNHLHRIPLHREPGSSMREENLPKNEPGGPISQFSVAMRAALDEHIAAMAAGELDEEATLP